MKWLRPKRPGIPSDWQAEPDWAVVHNRLEKAGMLDQEDAVVAFLRQAAKDYQVEAVQDSEVAWSGQVVSFLERVERARLALSLTRSDQTVLRATNVHPLAYAKTEDTLDQLVADLKALLKDLPEPERGGSPAVIHDRQLRLAIRFWQVFEENGWDTTVTANSLMAQLLKLVLEAAGEKRTTIKKLLDEARLEYIKSK